MVEMGRASCSIPLVLLLLSFLSCLFLAHAAAAGGNRKMLLSGVGDPAAGGAQEVPTMLDREVAAGTDPTLVLRDDEEMVVARRVDLQTEDYPGSGANGRHDPRNPH
uniref:Uncharacterized protein n=1 Tax=Avena sativa TaxID=4498 RepID=A0ACD5VEV4_AVESA